MSDILRKALARASNVKNRVDPRRVSIHVPGSSSQEADVPMSDLEAVDSHYRIAEKSPRSQRKKSLRERGEKSRHSDDSSSESDYESDSESGSDEQLRGSQRNTDLIAAANNNGPQQVNMVNQAHHAPNQQPHQPGQIQGQDVHPVHEGDANDDGNQQVPVLPGQGNGGDGQNPPNVPENNDVADLLRRLLNAVAAPADNRQQRRARERKKDRDNGRVPAELPEFSGKDGSITLEEWVSRLSQTAELRHWSKKQTLYVMLCKLKPPASDYVYGLDEERRNSIDSLIYELTMLYGETRLSKQDHYRELLKAPQLPAEKASDYLNRTLVHYRHLKNMDRLSLLELLIAPEYSEQLRLANVQQFDQALPVLLAYEKTLKNSSALSRPVNQHVNTSVNAIQTFNNNHSNDVPDFVRKNREELENLRDRFDNVETLIRELNKLVRKNNNGKPQQSQCKIRTSQKALATKATTDATAPRVGLEMVATTPQPKTNQKTRSSQ